MPIDLYMVNGSPPCRFVVLVADALGLAVNVKHVDFSAGISDQSELAKLNPQRKVPTIVDDGFTLTESRAIARYFVNKYGGESSLYPKAAKARAVVDQRLDFDLGWLYPRLAKYFYPQIFDGEPACEESLKSLHESLVHLNTFLAGNKYVAGEELTIADLALVVTVSTIDAISVNLEEYPNIVRWYELIKTTATNYEEANGKGAEICRELLEKSQSKH